MSAQGLKGQGLGLKSSGRRCTQGLVTQKAQRLSSRLDSRGALVRRDFDCSSLLNQSMIMIDDYG